MGAEVLDRPTVKRVRARIRKETKVAGVSSSGEYSNLDTRTKEERERENRRTAFFKRKDMLNVDGLRQLATGNNIVSGNPEQLLDKELFAELSAFSKGVASKIEEFKKRDKEDTKMAEAERMGLGDFAKGVQKAIDEFRANKR